MECEFRWLCGCLLLRPPRAYLNVAVNWTVDPSWVNCVSCRKNDQRGSMEFRRLGPKEGVGVLGEGRAANHLPPVRWIGERLYISCLSGFCGGAPVAQRSVCSLRSPGSSDCYVIKAKQQHKSSVWQQVELRHPPPGGREITRAMSLSTVARGVQPL